MPAHERIIEQLWHQARTALLACPSALSSTQAAAALDRLMALLAGKAKRKPGGGDWGALSLWTAGSLI